MFECEVSEFVESDSATSSMYDRALAAHLAPILAAGPGGIVASALEDACDGAVLAELSDHQVVTATACANRITGWACELQLRAIAELWARWTSVSEQDIRALNPHIDDAALARCRATATALLTEDITPAALVTEVALACGISERLAAGRLDAALALIIRRRLPRTRQLLAEGVLDWAKVTAIVTATESLNDDQARDLEALVLDNDRMAQITRTLPALREALAAAALHLGIGDDPDRATRARDERHVSCHANPDGTGTLWAHLPGHDAIALNSQLDGLARAARAGNDPRTHDQRRVDALTDAVTTAYQQLAEPAGTAQTGTAPTDDEPGTAPTSDDQPGTEPNGDDEPGSDDEPSSSDEPGPGKQPDPGAPVAGQTEVVVTISLETLLGLRDDPAYLERYGPIAAHLARDLAANGTWRCAAIDDTHATLLGLGATAFTPAYTPGKRLTSLIRTTWRHCAVPGCRIQASRCDLDHRAPHAKGGATCDCNLHALCRRHHRLKTSGQLRVALSDDPSDQPGTLTWTTRAGHRHKQAPEPLLPLPSGRPIPASRHEPPDDPPF